MSGGLLLLIFGGMAVVSGISQAVVLLWGPRARARKRLRDGADKLADGEPVTLRGTVRALEPLLEAPLSGKPCVAFEAHLKIFEMHGRNRILVDDAYQLKLASFVLETAHGPVIVEGEFAELEMPAVPLIPRKLERERAFARAHGKTEVSLRAASTEELVVEPGSKVAVHGVVRFEANPDADAGYRDAPPRVRLIGHDKHPLTIARR